MQGYVTEQDSYNIPDGATINAVYCGRQVTGVVVDSRCKYGTRKQYSLKLLHDVKFDWSGSDKQKGSIILIDNTDVVGIVTLIKSVI